MKKVKIFTTHDDFDDILVEVIKKGVANVSDVVLKKHQIMMYAADLLLKHGLGNNCIDLLKNTFELSESTARIILNEAPSYYCRANPFQEANFIRMAIYGHLAKTRILIDGVQDEKAKIAAYNQNDRNFIDFAKNLLPNVNAIDYEKYKPQPTIVQFKPSLVVEPEMSDEALDKEIENLRIVKDDNQYTKFTPYEEVEN